MTSNPSGRRARVAAGSTTGRAVGLVAVATAASDRIVLALFSVLDSLG